MRQKESLNSLYCYNYQDNFKSEFQTYRHKSPSVVKASHSLMHSVARYTHPERHNESVLPHFILYVIYELASISAHFSRICWFLVLATSRFAFVRSSLCARKHLLTCVLASLHMPIAFHKKPRAWHSSRSVMTSLQAGKPLAWRV
jgi:hypothetical protein